MGGDFSRARKQSTLLRPKTSGESTNKPTGLPHPERVAGPVPHHAAKYGTEAT